MVPFFLNDTATTEIYALSLPGALPVSVVIVAAFMGLLNVAETVVVSGTPVAPFGGAWAVTVGATSVVKLHTEAVPSGVAMVSVTVAATVAAQTLPGPRRLVGGSRAIRPAALSG